MSLFNEEFYTDDFDQEMLDWIKDNLKITPYGNGWDVSHNTLKYSSILDYFWTSNCNPCKTKLTKQQFKDKIGMPTTKQFTKADLKDGMVVTLRNGRQGIVFDECIERLRDDVRETGCDNPLIPIRFYLDDLTTERSKYHPEGCEIDKVEYMGETIWQREPEQCPKQKQLDELYKQIDELKAKADMIKGGE